MLRLFFTKNCYSYDCINKIRVLALSEINPQIHRTLVSYIIIFTLLQH